MLGVWRRLLNTLRSTNHTAHTHTNTSTHVSHIGLFGSEILFRKSLDCERRSGSGSCCLCHSEQRCYCDCCCGLSLTARRDSLLASHVFLLPPLCACYSLCARDTRRGIQMLLWQRCQPATKIFHLLPLVNSPSKLFPLRVLSFVVVVLTNYARAFCRVFALS